MFGFERCRPLSRRLAVSYFPISKMSTAATVLPSVEKQQKQFVLALRELSRILFCIVPLRRLTTVLAKHLQDPTHAPLMAALCEYQSRREDGRPAQMCAAFVPFPWRKAPSPGG